ncbi:UNVERIFIED_CONTAM: hypothetical protein K2H54_001262 [Gekko kuhli]
MNIPTLERRDFVPEAAFRLDLRRQLDALAPLAVPSRARQPLAGAAAPAFTPERRQRSSIVFPEASPAEVRSGGTMPGLQDSYPFWDGNDSSWDPGSYNLLNFNGLFQVLTMVAFKTSNVYVGE